MEVLLPLLAEELWDGRKKARRMQISQNLQFTEMGSSSQNLCISWQAKLDQKSNFTLNRNC